MPFPSAVGMCLMSGCVKGTAVSYFHGSLQGAIHRRQAVKPRAAHLQLASGVICKSHLSGESTATLYNRERGGTEAEEALRYP